VTPASRFPDRTSAGIRLAEAVAALMREHPEIADPVLLALPRGGVPVALEIARALRAPLDLVMVRKIGVPWQPELAAAAVVDGDAPQLVVNRDVLAMAGMTEADLEAAERRELAEIDRRRRLYLGDRAHRPGRGSRRHRRRRRHRHRRHHPRRAQGRAPAAAAQPHPRRPRRPADTLEKLAGEVDHLVCLAAPTPFFAIGSHYADFAQVSDDEVVRMLREAEGFVAPGRPP
jgi:putative phosphoribosyl transferase